MSEEKGYLKFLINEPIYLVKEPVDSSTVEVVAPSEETVEEKVETQTADQSKQEVADPVDLVAEPEIDKKQEAPVPEEKVVVIPTKKLLVIYQFEEAEALPVHLKKLMLKIIGAVGIDVMQGVYVNPAFKELPSQLSDFENILVFGTQQNLTFKGYQDSHRYAIQEFAHTRVLVSDELSLVSQQIPLKKQLWTALQKMFPK